MQIVLTNVSKHGSLNDRPTEIGKQLVGWIKKEFEIVGLTPTTTYLKVDAKKDEIFATFVHPWAMVTLLYKHKTLPFCIQVNSGMRKDEMLLAQIPFNSSLFDNEDVIGLTS